MRRLADLIAHFGSAWKLGAFALLMFALGGLGFAVPIGIGLVLLGAAVELVAGPLPWAEALLGPLVVALALPFGAGVAMPFLKAALAEFEAEEAARRRRAIARTVSRYD